MVMVSVGVVVGFGFGVVLGVVVVAEGLVGASGARSGRGDSGRGVAGGASIRGGVA